MGGALGGRLLGGGLLSGGLLASALLAGCAAAEANPTQGTDPATSLAITMREVDGHGQTSAFTLSCDPVGGDLPTAVSACQNLAAGPDPFAPVPDGTACLQMIEGPGLITVRGVWNGTAVQAQFSQINSCENERFESLLQTLGVS